MMHTTPVPNGHEAISELFFKGAVSPKSDRGPEPEVWRDMYIEPATVLLKIWQSTPPAIPSMSPSSASDLSALISTRSCQSSPLISPFTDEDVHATHHKALLQPQAMVLRSHSRQSRGVFWELDPSSRPRLCQA